MILIRGFAYRFIIHLGQNWNATWRNARSRHLEPRGTRPDDKSNTLLPMARFFPIFFSFFPPLSLIPFRPTNSSSSSSFARRPNRAIETLERREEYFLSRAKRFRERPSREPSVLSRVCLRSTARQGRARRCSKLRANKSLWYHRGTQIQLCNDSACVR